MRRLLVVFAVTLFSVSVKAQGDGHTARQYYSDVEQAVISNHGSNVILVQAKAQAGDDPMGQPMKIDATTGKAYL